MESSLPSFSVFRPPTSVGTTFGLGVVGVAALLGGVLVLKGLSMDVGLDQMGPLVAGAIFLGLAALYAYWTWSCRSIVYVVDRNALSIRWGSLRQVVPLTKIERLIPGTDEDESPQIEGVNWLGHHVGRAEIADFGGVLFYSTHLSMRLGKDLIKGGVVLAFLSEFVFPLISRV